MDYRERWELKEYRAGRRFSARTVLLHVLLVLVLLGYLWTFWYLQVVQGEEYAHLAEANRLRKIPVPPSRGVIYDRHREVLASTRPSLDLVLVREGLQDGPAQLRRLAPVLGQPYEALQARLDAMRSRPTFEPLVLVEDVKLDVLAKIESRREWFPSVEVQQAARRDYLNGRALAHVLGYVGEVTEAQLAARAPDEPLEQGDIVGKAGVERAYDATLRGRRGWKFVTVNNLGRPLGETQEGRSPESGQPLHLTLDFRLQEKLWEALGEEAGAGVFLDPWSGEVLALASTPSFDPNDFASGISAKAWSGIVQDPRKPLNDRAVVSAYAPGSTFKVLMSVVGLESGVITPGTVMYCGGSANFYGRNFLCWKKGGHGAVTVHEALVHSCNVFFYRVGQTAGIEAIARYGAMFSLGRPTGIDLPEERTGVLPSPEWKQRVLQQPWYAGETISVSIGQGLVNATPLQMATLISGVASGQLVRPHLWREHAEPPRPLPLRPETLGVIRAALQDVVEEGTGRRASLGPITVAGKTGTAQVFKHSAGIDADKLPKDERDHAWFVGYAPADKPEIAFAVVVEHGGHGGTTAAPIVRQVLEVYFEDRLPRKPAAPPAPAPAVPDPLRAQAPSPEIARAGPQAP